MEKSSKMLNRLAAAVVGPVLLFANQDRIEKQKQFVLNSFMMPRPADALLRQEDKKHIQSINTNVYVYGEGF